MTNRAVKCAFRSIVSVMFATVIFLAGIEMASARLGADFYPNLPLVNQDGKVMKFYDDVIKGKVVAINFMFTSCEDSCPLETAKLRDVKGLLGDHVGKNVHMYSITVDPEVDTPARLKAYKKKFKIGDDWDFLTGKKKDIDTIRRKMGMYTTVDKAEELNDHAITFILGNETTGQWLKRTPFDLPETLVAVLLGRLQTKPLKTASLRNYSESRISKARVGVKTGADLFNSRCASCHDFGKGDTLGPDLIGVATKRDPAWLIRWLVEPDKMIREKDPLAMQLYLQYDKRNMPNLKLTPDDAKLLIGYMRERTRQIMQVRYQNDNKDIASHDHHGASHEHQHTH